MSLKETSLSRIERNGVEFSNYGLISFFFITLITYFCIYPTPEKNVTISLDFILTYYGASLLIYACILRHHLLNIFWIQVSNLKVKSRRRKVVLQGVNFISLTGRCAAKTPPFCQHLYFFSFAYKTKQRLFIIILDCAAKSLSAKRLLLLPGWVWKRHSFLPASFSERAGTGGSKQKEPD